MTNECHFVPFAAATLARCCNTLIPITSITLASLPRPVAVGRSVAVDRLLQMQCNDCIFLSSSSSPLSPCISPCIEGLRRRLPMFQSPRAECRIRISHPTLSPFLSVHYTTLLGVIQWLFKFVDNFWNPLWSDLLSNFRPLFAVLNCVPEPFPLTSPQPYVLRRLPASLPFPR